MRATEDMSPAISVNALTTTPELDIDPEAGLFINGIAIDAESGRALQAFVYLINGSLGNETNVVASLDDTGTNLILANADGYVGNDIRIGVMDADGELESETYYKGKLNFGEDDAISIGYGEAGLAGDLDLLGIPLGTYSTSLYPTLRLEAGIESARIPSTVDDIVQIP